MEGLILYMLFFKVNFFGFLFLTSFFFSTLPSYSFPLPPIHIQYQVPRISILFDSLHFRRFLICLLIKRSLMADWSWIWSIFSITLWLCDLAKTSSVTVSPVKNENIIIILIISISKICHEGMWVNIY